MILKKQIDKFENIIGYNFKDKSILKQSLTHPSSLKDKNILFKHPNNFERLEFLGDRVLGLIVSNLLFHKYENFNEGDLSKKYSYLVQKNFLHKISEELFIRDILVYNFKKNNQKMLISILSDSVESLIGAIFIDGGYKASYNFIKKFWSKYLDIKILKTENPKTVLQELSQQRLKKLPEYKMINKKGPSHSPIFTITLKVLNLNKITAKGSSIREAEKKAALTALGLINEKKIIKN